MTEDNWIIRERGLGKCGDGPVAEQVKIAKASYQAAVNDRHAKKVKGANDEWPPLLKCSDFSVKVEVVCIPEALDSVRFQEVFSRFESFLQSQPEHVHHEL